MSEGDWKAHAKALEAEVKKLRTELTTAREEARADKARLDSGKISLREPLFDGNICSVVFKGVNVVFKGVNLRASIDNAAGE